MSTRNWLAGIVEGVLNRHFMMRNESHRNKLVEKMKERKPKVATATRPRERTPGSGESVLDASFKLSITRNPSSSQNTTHECESKKQLSSWQYMMLYMYKLIEAPLVGCTCYNNNE
jgi:hypothetical protein